MSVTGLVPLPIAARTFLLPLKGYLECMTIELSAMTNLPGAQAEAHAFAYK